MSHIKHHLLDKTILSIEIDEDKDVIRFHCTEGEVIGRCYGDCCSTTWIEHVEYPALGYPAHVLNVENLGLVGSEDDHPEHDCLQLYGYKLSTEKGDLIIDFRNSSNGYYGGSLEWAFKPKEIDMSTTEQESIKHTRQTSETLDTSKETITLKESGEDIRTEHSCPVEVAPPLFDSQGNATQHYKSLPRAERVAMWVTQPHPKFAAAQVASNERKAKQRNKEAALKHASAYNGFRFLVFGRLTVCYRRSKHVLQISTTLRNTKDADKPLDAKMSAAYRMLHGEYIVIPIHSKTSAKYALQHMFFFATFV